MNQSNQQAILSPCALTLCTNTCDYHLPTTLTPLLDNTKIVYEYHIPLFIPLKTCGREKLYSGSVYILWSKVTDTVYCYCGQTQKILVPFLKHKSKVRCCCYLSGGWRKPGEMQLSFLQFTSLPQRVLLICLIFSFANVMTCCCGWPSSVLTTALIKLMFTFTETQKTRVWD